MNDQPNPAAPETAKNRVLARWPDARVWRGWKGPHFVGTMISGEDNGYPEIGHGETEEAAWIDAASRLAAVPVPPPEEELECNSRHPENEDTYCRRSRLHIDDHSADTGLDWHNAAAEGKRTVTFEEWWSNQDTSIVAREYVITKSWARSAWNAARETKEDEG